MDIFTEFATDEKLEVEGRWVPYDDKTSFKIARANNPQFLKVFNDTQRKNRHALRAKGPAADELSKRLLIDILATTILVDWKGPVAIKGEDLGPYSVDAAKKALASKGFRVWVAEQSEDESGYKLDESEEAVKN